MPLCDDLTGLGLRVEGDVLRVETVFRHRPGRAPGGILEDRDISAFDADSGGLAEADLHGVSEGVHGLAVYAGQDGRDDVLIDALKNLVEEVVAVELSATALELLEGLGGVLPGDLASLLRGVEQMLRLESAVEFAVLLAVDLLRRGVSAQIAGAVDSGLTLAGVLIEKHTTLGDDVGAVLAAVLILRSGDAENALVDRVERQFGSHCYLTSFPYALTLQAITS